MGKQGRSIDKIIDCCTKLGIDRSQVERDSSVSIHNINFQVLVTDVKNQYRYFIIHYERYIWTKSWTSLQFVMYFSIFAPLVSTVFHGTESISFFAPKIWSLLPENFEVIDSLENFKILIKTWKPVKLPLKAMQSLHEKCGIYV